MPTFYDSMQETVRYTSFCHDHRAVSANATSKTAQTDTKPQNATNTTHHKSNTFQFDYAIQVPS